MKKLRIVFMGTPDFAVPSLQILLETGYDIAAVVTAPDKPSGRGMRISGSAVKDFAASRNLKILQPEKLKNPEFLSELKSLQVDLQVVVAFRMLPESVWNMPPMGTINLHGSLLPQYRGAAPVNRAIMNGEAETGVTTFKLQHEIDTGHILLQEKMKIGDSETAGELHDRMKLVGAGLLLRTVNGLADGSLVEISQSDLVSATGDTDLHPAPKISSDTCEIDWEKDISDIYNLVRGLSPYPAAFTFLNGRKLKIFKAKKEYVDLTGKPAEHFTDNKSFLKFSCINGNLHLMEVQLEGKKRLNIEDFLRGWRD